MMDNLLLDPFERLIEDQCSSVAIRAIESGDGLGELWSAVSDSGFLDALVPEKADGAGLSLSDIAPLLQVLGRFAAPAPIAETMVARALLAEAGFPSPSGPIVLAAGPGPVPLGLVAEHALIDTGHELVLTALGSPRGTGVHHSLAAFPPKPQGSGFARPSGGLRPISAVLRACAIAGAADRLLSMTIDYANERVQFGKPIGKQQIIQQQLAVMAEQAVACRIAAQLGCSAGFPPLLAAAATAKQVTSRAAAEIANIAHAVHGAIGISEEFDLQLYTRRLHEWRLADGSEDYWARLLGQQRLEAAGIASVDFVRRKIFAGEPI